MQLFYAPDIDPEAGHYLFPEEESAHAVRVLRLREGDGINITDGRGALLSATVAVASPKKCEVNINGCQREYEKRPYTLHVAIAPTKNTDRLEWFVEKATEMGIDRITPILCEHSERKAVKTDRLVKVAVSAMKQSLKAYCPQVDEMTAFKEFIKEPFAGRNFIACCGEPERAELRGSFSAGDDVRILIGPEGDFSPKEVAMAKEAGFVPVSLGKMRLRTETAALFSAAAVSLING